MYVEDILLLVSVEGKLLSMLATILFLSSTKSIVTLILPNIHESHNHMELFFPSVKIVEERLYQRKMHTHTCGDGVGSRGCG